MSIVQRNVDLVVQPYIKFINILKKNRYEFFHGKGFVGSNIVWEKSVKDNYDKDKKQVFLLGGDYQERLDFTENKLNTIFLRQSLLLSQKAQNEILIPSSYGCVAGDIDMDLCKIDTKPKISFCGSKNSHPIRNVLFSLLENSDEIECNFDFIESPCNGYADIEIEKKVIRFNKNLETSEFTFCPRGNGNFSIRFYEALMSGRIPVVLNTDNELPFKKYINWNEVCVVSHNKDNLLQDIIQFHKNNDLIDIQKKCKTIFKKYFIEHFDVLLYTYILEYEASLKENIVYIPKIFPRLEHIECYSIEYSYTKFHQPYVYNLDINKKFWFSRGGGQEGVLAYDAHVLNNEEYMNGILCQNNNFFINGCGIYFTNKDSCLEYCKRYIEAIKKVDLYGAYAKENHPHQEKITDYLSHHGIDVVGFIHPFIEYFHYNDEDITFLKKIYNNKKILVVSSHKESIKHQIPYLKYINPLLANCQFQVIKPPQTSCGNHGNIDWSEHLSQFLTKLDKVDDFDIALVAAGGYSILISEYIYEKMNKSVIYPGGGLQLYFGIMGNRWKKYWKNHRKGSEEYWIEPLDIDKPTNSYLVDGNGAYW
jgi:hypothetical protein